MKISFDGRGLNDKSDQYAPRIATFSNDEMAQRFGTSLEAMPDVLAALEDLVARCEYYSCEKWFPHVMDRAHAAIAKAKGGAR